MGKNSGARRWENGEDEFGISSHNRSRSRSPYRRNRSRSRSRSPYRAGKATGEKRRHDDDHYGRRNGSEPRRLKVQYDDSRASSRGSEHGSGDKLRRPHADPYQSQRTLKSPLYDAQSLNGEKLDASFVRQRSRSPSRRYTHTPSADNHHDMLRDHPNRSHDSARDKQSEARPPGGSERVQVQHYEDNQHTAHESPRDLGGEMNRQEATLGASEIAHTEETQVKEHETQTTLSEEELIEQRRKRREAIKAKHKSGQPLLVQALEQSLHSAPGTPIHETGAESTEQHSPASMSSPQTPQTPQRDTPPGSPNTFSVDRDEELVDLHYVNNVTDEEGPSAADYDPNMDMQEGKKDAQKQALQERRTNGNSYTHVDDDHGDVMDLSAPINSSNDDFDMFADNDDDDMFVPEDTKLKPATSTKQARTLDRSLLDNWDYPDGHYRIILGELLDGRYAVKQQIGKGTFATVVRAEDTRDGSFVAVKIACNNDTMYKAGQKEMDMLNILNQNDPDDKKHIIRLMRHFEHKGHLCLVFENLSADLREVLKKFGRNVGLNLKAIRSYAQQMFLALSLLKKCRILHADLKPDNMLVSEKRNLLKICDLGTASLAEDAEITPYLVSRFYRAPEVILGIPFDYAIDMWSIGCTLFELYTGRILFAGSDNNQMLRVIQECRGKFPMRMLKRASLVDKHYDAAGNFYSQERDKITGKPSVRQLNFSRISQGKDLRARLSGNVKDMHINEIKEHSNFVDLMEKCLQLDPARRISPNEALRHPFLAPQGSGVTAHQEGDKPKMQAKTAASFLRPK